jgi:tetraacyldisaccharide 4'-kinase
MTIEQTYRNLVSGRWRGPVAAALRGGLTALEQPYRWAVARKNLRFDQAAEQVHKVVAPVISVGNLTVGGTGKTPLVAWLARWFQSHGIPVTIISRGYGAQGGQPNDEARELAARLPGIPHLQNRDRVAAARQALEANSKQVLLLDDAFQHRRLARDLDIVLLDALAPFGYGHLLPRGLLREPVTALARAQIIALSRSDAVDETLRQEIRKRVHDLAPAAVWLELKHKPTRFIAADGETKTLAELRGEPLAAFCGIGNPAGFRHTLQASGLAIARWRELPDHCHYSPVVLSELDEWAAKKPGQHLLCTCKDLVKIDRYEIGEKRLWALEIEVEIARGQAALEDRLTNVTAQFHSV